MNDQNSPVVANVSSDSSLEEDQFSAVKFLPTGNEEDELFVVATLWDGSLQLYDLHKNLLVLNEKYCKDEMPVLAVAPVGGHKVAFGGSDANVYVKKFDLQNQSGQQEDGAHCIGSHAGSVTAVDFCQLHNVIVTGGRDGYVRLWSQQDEKVAAIGRIATEEQVVRMDVRGNLIAAGLSGGVIDIWDIRNYNERLKSINISESLNLQCLAIFPDMKRVVFGTTQGKACIESFDGENSKNDFVFKSHVDKAKGITHPVNCVRFIDDTSKFLMGGSDGKLKIWDPDHRKLVVDFSPYPNEVVAVDASPSGNYAVVACSYLDDRELEEGTEIPPSELHFRNISEYH